jgi:hypothetical protein
MRLRYSVNETRYTIVSPLSMTKSHPNSHQSDPFKYSIFHVTNLLYRKFVYYGFSQNTMGIITENRNWSTVHQ